MIDIISFGRGIYTNESNKKEIKQTKPVCLPNSFI